MIIKSYLAFPVEGRLSELVNALEAMPACEVIEATNRDLIILVTETDGDSDEKDLENALHAIPSLQALTLVSGHNES